MQALTEIKPGESCTVKWMVTGARIAEWMEKHSITEGSRIRVIQNCMGDLIIGTEKEKEEVKDRTKKCKLLRNVGID